MISTGLTSSGADVATKDDLRMLGLEIRAEITELRTELRDEIHEVHTELAGFGTDVADGQRRLTLTLVAAMVIVEPRRVRIRRPEQPR